MVVEAHPSSQRNKDKKTDGTAVDVCDRLVNEAELTGPRGCTLYTDNYYTSVKIAKHLFEKYRWTMVGTIVLTDKKMRGDHDIPFLKLSNGARNGLERGWFCEAFVKLSAGKTPYYLQCTTWKDKKQVSFFSNNKVGWSDGMTVQMHVRGKRTRNTIAAPRAQADYVVECATENSSLPNCWQRRGRRHAEPLQWDAQSARNLFAKSAGKRGMINMHNFT